MTTIYVYYLQSSDLLCQIINELTLFFKRVTLSAIIAQNIKIYINAKFGVKTLKVLSFVPLLNHMTLLVCVTKSE